MITYYDKAKQRFVEQKTPTTSNAKILISIDDLEANKVGTYGPDELPGQYISVIGGIEFMWDDLNETLINPAYDIKVLHPLFPDSNQFVLLNR